MSTCSPNLDLAKALVPVFSAAFVATIIWLYRTTYSSLREPTSQSITTTPPFSSQEPDDLTQEQAYYTVDGRLSLRDTKPPDLIFHPTPSAKWTHKPHGTPGFDLHVVMCEYWSIFDSIARSNNAILYNPERLPYRFPVDATINEQEVEWSTQNLGLLTQELDTFWKALGGGQRCSKLTIRLPSDPLDEVTDGAGILAVTTEALLPLGLRTLEWIGHREQLPMFFQNQRGFSTLTNLTIHSELSMDDCKTLLYWGRETLRSVAFRTIRDVDPGEVRVSLPPVPNSVQLIEMAALRSLTMASTVDIRPLYSLQPLIRFPVLGEVTLLISDPAFNIWKCRGWLTMGGMRFVRKWKVHCPMSPGEKARMETNYPSARIVAGIPNL